MNSKWKLALTVVGVIISIILLSVSAFLAENGRVNNATAIALIIFSLCILFVAIFFAAKVDYETGEYECRKCGHAFKPTFGAYIMGAHTLTARRLRCPKCDGVSWCKRKII